MICRVPKLFRTPTKRRKKLHVFCDEKSYLENLTNEYIYRHFDCCAPHPYIPCNNHEKKDINKYVGKVVHHLNINKNNDNVILYSIPTILDIFCFNYFSVHNSYKIVFFYNLVKIPNQKSVHEKKRETKKQKVFQHIAHVLIHGDLHHVHQIKHKYVAHLRRLQQIKEPRKNEQSKTKEPWGLIPVSANTFLEDLVEQAKNVKELCIILIIIKNVLSFYKFDYDKIVNKILKKCYHCSKELQIKGEFEIPAEETVVPKTCTKKKNIQLRDVQLRDIIYICYQIVTLQKNYKNEFLLLKIWNLIVGNGENEKRQHHEQSQEKRKRTYENLMHREHTLSVYHLSNKDAEQTLVVCENIPSFRFYLLPIVIAQFVTQLFRLHYFLLWINKISLYMYNKQIFSHFMKFHADFKKDLSNPLKNSKHPTKGTISYFEICYYAICVKYLLKQKNEKMRNHSPILTMEDRPFSSLSLFFLFKNSLKRIISYSFYLHKNKFPNENNNKRKTNVTSFRKYATYGLLQFSKSKVFLLNCLKLEREKTHKIRHSNRFKKKRCNDTHTTHM